MDNDMPCVHALSQPWWRVRTQLVVVLVLLTALCIALWTDTPVRKWMVREVVLADFPPVAGTPQP